MNKIIAFTIGLFFLALHVAGQEMPNFSKNQLLVKFKADAPVDRTNCTKNCKFGHARLDLLSAKYKVAKVSLTGNKHEGLTYCLHFQEEQDILNLIGEYKDTKLFDVVEPNYIGKGHSFIPNDPFFSRQYSHLNDGSINGSVADADIDMDLAWEVEQGDPSIIVAVLDSGIKLNHPEMVERIWFNLEELPNNTDTDANGYTDDFRGWDFVNGDNEARDDHGHGTNVTGILAATGNNGIGYAGVDWNCTIMPLKILDNENLGFYTWWTDAIYYAVDNGARVLNMSVGGSGYSQIMREAAEYAHENGVTIVVSSGNENRLAPSYPSGYPTTIAVGSTNSNDQLTRPFFWSQTSGSNFGPHIDVVAPGNFIYGLNYLSNTNYDSYWGGTSQAAPLVAGLASLLLAQESALAPDDIRDIIRSTAEDQVGRPTEDTPGYDIYHGHGRINAYDALTSLITKDEETHKMDFRVYPNPSAGLVTVAVSPSVKDIYVYDAGGQLVQQVAVSSDESMVYIDLSAEARGVYFFRAVDSAGEVVLVERVLLYR